MPNDICSLAGLKELSGFCCRGWCLYRPTCNCLCFCTNYKYGRYKTLGGRLDLGHLISDVRGSASLCTFSYSLKTFIRQEIVTRFRLKARSHSLILRIRFCFLKIGSRRSDGPISWFRFCSENVGRSFVVCSHDLIFRTNKVSSFWPQNNHRDMQNLSAPFIFQG